METLNVSSSLASKLALAETQIEACAIFVQELGASRRVTCIHDGVEFRNCALTGSITSQGGAITSFGLVAGATTASAADLTIGSARMRVEGGGHSVEGSLGLPESGCFFIIEANPTASNGLAISGLSIVLCPDLPLGIAPDIPYEVVYEDWSTGSAGARESLYFDEDGGDIISEDPDIFAERGAVPYRISSKIFTKGEGGKRMRIGMHLVTLPPNCNATRPTKPVHIVFGLQMPDTSTRWAGWPSMAGYNPATDSTYMPACKLHIYDAFGKPLGTMDQARDHLPLNSREMSQTRTSTKPWRPWGDCKQMLRWASDELKLSVNARKWYAGMVPGTSNRPGQCREIASSNPAIPSFGTGYQQINGFCHIFYMPPWSLSTTEVYEKTPGAITFGMATSPSGNAIDGAQRPESAVGYMYEWGSTVGFDKSMPEGGNRSGRFGWEPTTTMYLTDPAGVRPQGSVPLELLCRERMKGYFSRSWHDCTDVRTAAGLPWDEVSNGQWAYCYGKYTPQGPIFVPGGESKHISWFRFDNQPVYRDFEGVPPYHGADYEPLHAYDDPVWAALMFNDVAAEFCAVFAFKSHLLSNGNPYFPYDSADSIVMMKRQHAWRWMRPATMWKIGSKHPALLSRAQIEARMIPEFEFVDDTIRMPAQTPGHAKYNTPFSVGLRNFGIPGQEYNRGDGYHCIGAVDDAKLLYLGSALAIMEAVGFTARMTALSTKAGNTIQFVKECLYRYSVNSFEATRGRKLFWENGQISPFVPTAQAMVAYPGYVEWAAEHAPVDGQADLVRLANGDPHYHERHQYQHLWVQAINLFKTHLGGEAKWPGITAVCAQTKEQGDFYANLVAGGYGYPFGDYQFCYPSAGIAAPLAV